MGRAGNKVRRRWMVRRAAAAVVCIAMAGVTSNAALAQTASDTKPYDEKLIRLAEILGSIHFLRELCSNEDGQA